MASLPLGKRRLDPFPLTPSLEKKSSISVPVIVSSGGIPGFRCSISMSDLPSSTKSRLA